MGSYLNPGCIRSYAEARVKALMQTGKFNSLFMDVDAAGMALPVGSIRLLDKRDVARKSMFTTHSLPLSILIEEIEQSCDDIVFVGIQPGDTEFYNPMSPEVFDAVDAVYDAVAANDFSHFVRLGQEQ